MPVAGRTEEIWQRLAEGIRGEVPVIAEGSSWLGLRFCGEGESEEQAIYIKVVLISALNEPHIYIAAHAGPRELLPALAALRWNHRLEIGALALEQDHLLLTAQFPLPIDGAGVEKVCSILAYFVEQLPRIRAGHLAAEDRGPELGKSAGLISHWTD